MQPEVVVSAEHVLSFWLGELDAEGLASEATAARWYLKDPAFDAEVLARFGATYSALMRGAHDDWLEAPRSLLAYVIVLDQFSRNMFRGKSQAFASDGQALAAAHLGIRKGFDRALVGQERVFLYMPFMHSEALATQDECVRLFAAFRDESTGALRQVLEQNVDYAVRHRAVIAAWGRFPHRNQSLDRTSTAEERLFLQQPGSSF
ncbi:MAG: hypothetical protein RLZZ450_5949 [Pseudomonadota bacterium]|jgi:uncharacterized protein (DUF924 family)